MPTGHFGLDMVENEPDRVLEIAEAARHRDDLLSRYLPPDQRPTDAAGWTAFGRAAGRRPASRYRDAGLGFGWHNHDFEFETTRRRRDPAGARSSRAARTSSGRPTSPG